MSFISDAMDVLPAVGPLVNAITTGGPRRQYKWNKRAAEDANRMNRENQQWLLQQNKELQAEQRAYDEPKSQRSRYIAAGLNPNIVYGSGSSAGQAFPIDSGSVPSVNIQPPSARYPDVLGAYLGASQSVAQTELVKQKTEESITSQAYKSVLIEIAKTNPMLSPGVSERIAASMYQAAQLKLSTDTHLLESWVQMGESQIRLGQAKISAEIQDMIIKLGLNTQDLKIKNQIFESKVFENALKEIQVKWMRDNEITPQLMLQGGMQILKQLLGAGLQK